MHVQPYLMFEGRCEDAINYYRRTFGAELIALMRYKESPEPHQPGMIPEGSENKVMHSSFRIGDSVIMASDGMCSGKPNFAGISLVLNVATDADAERLFAAVADGGTVQMPIGETFFATRFGMVADRFGVSWMIIGAVKQP
jgi:PhnB protein